MLILRLIRAVRRIRGRRSIGLLLVAALLSIALLGNACCFYLFERAVNPELSLGDALWYSVISISTIGYGDFAATTPGARLGTVLFIVVLGLTSFSLFFGMALDWFAMAITHAQRGLGRAMVKDHILIVHFPSEQRVKQLISEIRSDSEHGTCEIVIISTAIDELPFVEKDVVFVRGSSHDVETYQRAGAETCRMAIVLSPNYGDRNSDAIVAAAVSVIDRVSPTIHIVAECVNEKHLPLFHASRCELVVLGMTIAGNLLVQEVHDPGVAKVVEILTSNRVGTTLFSVRVEDPELPYSKLAQALIDHAINVIAVNRGDETLTTLTGLASQPGDRLIFVAERRVDWQGLRRLYRV